MKSSSSSSLDIINIEARTQRLDVDNRFTLNIYFRIATNILKQAEIFRAEKNIIDLYVMLLRFSSLNFFLKLSIMLPAFFCFSLVSETIPCHRGYRAFPQSKKDYLRKNFLNALGELEQLKTAVQQRINELNKKRTHQVNGWGLNSQNDLLEKHPYNKKILNGNGVTKAVRPVTGESLYQGSRTQQYSYVRPVEQQFRRVSLNFQRPNEETLSRHSILGPNGLNGQWQPPRTNEGESVKAELPVKSEHISSEPGISSLESILTVQDDNQKCRDEEPCSLISFETLETPVLPAVIRQPSPPPVLAEVQDLIPVMPPQVSEAEHKMDISSPDDLIRSEASLQLHISTALMENFMKMAKSNTDKNLETCGVLAGSLKNRKFYVTALIIPKQESTSDSCQTTNEEEIFEVQDKRSLFPLGWIHIMLPEAVAIVMAPRDSSRQVTHGIFRLTAPGGMSVIRQCQHRGFHPHDPPPDGGPIYKTCTDVYMNPELKFDVIDLR
ncbi:hypothetical protein SADUNF_Sadunf15G0039500 [Salix dunnii]|uniref:MPN domain-containing protein n=1 Tax=Salix dunnii TaxID=1413687 RepID=A0A835JDU3_9ROSI|nr:hypothetical protein SADUNF_Sadunf15G0039500 [Salix dunnii]